MTSTETLTSVVLVLGVLAVVIAWVVSYVLISNDKAVRTTAPASRELVTASSS